MKAAILEKPKKIIIKEIPKPQYSDDEVLIKIKEIGICGSDIHFYNNGRIGSFVVKEPIILGHESSGEIAEIGKNVKGFKIGDRVSIEPGIPCYKCDYCKSGNYNLCKDVRFMAAPPFNGAFVEYVKYDPNFVFKIPDDVSFTEGALVEPLSVGYHSALRGQIKPGDSVTITGSGPIGLSCMEISRVMGASKIFISDINDYRLKIAKEHGAFKTINVQKENLVESINEATDGEGCDCVLEASGAQQSIVDSLEIVKPGGKVVWVANIKGDMVTIPYYDITIKNISVEGVFRYKNFYKPIIKLLESGIIDFSYLVSHRFKLKDIEEAIRITNDPDIDKMKIMIEV